MAVINKTGITNGTTIQAEHVTRAIDALSGGSTDSVVATGSFNGTLTGNATTATTATTATNATNTAVTNTSTGTGPYYITFVESATGNVGQRVDATGLTYNATTDTITATASFATQALSASYAANVPATASYALAALSSSYAVTASFALNAGGGSGGGIFALTGSTYATTNNLQITGSLLVTAGVTASLQGTASVAISSSRAVTASFADLSRQVLVQRTAADADHFMVIVDSGNATPAAESLNTVTNIRVNPGTDTISAVNVSGSFNITGSMGATKFSTVDLQILGQASAGGQLAIPIQQTGGTPLAGSIYWDDSGARLYIYSATNAAWYSIPLNP
jgi:hypothetical protein